MQDLESGLSYMLKIEVANKPIIEGPAYIALQNFIDMLGEVRHTIKRLYDYHLSSNSTHDVLTLLSQVVNMTYNPSRNEHFTSQPFVTGYTLISTIKRIKQHCPK